MKILFIPVSGKDGIGEYMRSMILAQAMKDKEPEAEIHFALSEQAPYAKDCIYPTILTKRSPTYHLKEINNYIDEFKPDIVVFDASGRTSQIKHAKKSGALTVFIAQHDKKIRKGMRFGRLRYTDVFWIAQPEFTVHGLSFWSKFKLKLLKKPDPVFLGCVFVPPAIEKSEAVLEKYGLEKNNYIFISAGSGGHFMKNKELAAEGFNNAIRKLNLTTRYVQVWGANYLGEKRPENDGENINLESIPNFEFISLLANAKYAVINGGDTLLQALSLKIPFLAVPVSSDQPMRIKMAMEYAKCFLSADADSEKMVEQLKHLETEFVQKDLAEALKTVRVNNGYDLAATLLKV